MEHSPQPWKVQWEPYAKFLYVSFGPDGKRGIRGLAKSDLQEPDATLIAAAPELLEACKAALKFVELNFRYMCVS